MKKVFFKYFISIFSITVVIMLLQSAILVMQYSASQRKWRVSVYNDFVEALESSMEDSFEEGLASGQFGDFGLTNLRMMMSSMSDSRVSGYVVRDTEGSTMLTVGKTSEGRILGALLPLNQKPSASDGRLISTDTKNTVRLNMVLDGDSVDVERLSPYRMYQTHLVLPSAINADDVVGSITIAFEDEDLYIIDLLTYSPRTYAYSKDVIDSCLKGMVVSVPICLLIAFVSAWFISSRNTRFIDSVRNALNKLAKGESGVMIKRNCNSELNEISLAIEDLDQELQKNAMSRRAWLRSISHDLNTPASAIKMMVDGMEDGVFPLDGSSLEELRRESDTLNERIGKVIDFSSMQADTTPKIESISAQILENCIKRNLPSSEDGRGTVVFEPDFLNPGDDASGCDGAGCAGPCGEVSCDVALMVRACNELVKNAFEYGDDGTAVIHIGGDSSNYSIYVENPGSLPKDMEGDGFLEPWIRGDWSRTHGGSGLGLPIVCTVARLHGGSVSLENVGEGRVRATITWPVA